MSEPILPLAVWAPGTNQNSVPANDNSLRQEILQGLIIADDVTAQPGSPADGDAYIIPAAATGAQWSLFDEFDLTIYRDGTWYAYAPVEGIRVNLDGTLVTWDGAAYSPVAGSGSGDVVGPASATADRIAVFDGTTGKLIKDGGVTVAGLQPIDADLTAIAALSPSNDDILQRKAGAWTNRTMAQLVTDLALGSVYQPLDATLTALAGANWAANSLAIGSGSDTVAQVTFAANTFPARSSSGNLVAKTLTDFALTVLDDTDAATARTTLGAAQDRKTVSALATSGSVAIDYALGDYFTIALAGNVSTFTFSNLPGSGYGATLMVRITQDSTPRTVGWPASFKWEGGVAGVVSTASGAVDILAITTFDNGTTWRATLAKAWA